MFSMTKSWELEQGQSRYIDVNKRHYGEDVKFYSNKHQINQKSKKISLKILNFPNLT